MDLANIRPDNLPKYTKRSVALVLAFIGIGTFAPETRTGQTQISQSGAAPLATVEPTAQLAAGSAAQSVTDTIESIDTVEAAGAVAAMVGVSAAAATEAKQDDASPTAEVAAEIAPVTAPEIAPEIPSGLAVAADHEAAATPEVGLLAIETAEAEIAEVETTEVEVVTVETDEIEAVEIDTPLLTEQTFDQSAQAEVSAIVDVVAQEPISEVEVEPVAELPDAPAEVVAATQQLELATPPTDDAVDSTQKMDVFKVDVPEEDVPEEDVIDAAAAVAELPEPATSQTIEVKSFSAAEPVPNAQQAILGAVTAAAAAAINATSTETAVENPAPTKAPTETPTEAKVMEVVEATPAVTPSVTPASAQAATTQGATVTRPESVPLAAAPVAPATTAEPVADSAAGKDTTGDIPPPQAVADLVAKYPGKLLMVVFWSVASESTSSSFGWINEMQHRYANRGLKVLAVNQDETARKGEAFAVKQGVQFEIAHDRSGTLRQALWVGKLPATYLLNDSGELLGSHTGYNDNIRGSYEDEIRSLLQSIR